MPFKAKYDFGMYHKGDIVPDDSAKLFSEMYKESPTEFIEETIKVQEKKESLDLNNDGKFDQKDKQIAGKVLSSKRK